MYRILSPILGAVALSFLAQPVLAQSGSHPCAAILPPGERLQCYDQAFGAPAPEAQSVATTEKARELFGLSGKETQARLPEQMRTPTVDEIESTITKVSIDGRGGRVLTLDNGQIWQITENTRCTGSRKAPRSVWGASASMALANPSRKTSMPCPVWVLMQ